METEDEQTVGLGRIFMMLVSAAFALLAGVALVLFIVLEVVWIRVGRRKLREPPATA